MKKVAITIVICWMTSISVMGQSEVLDNGRNLQSSCPPEYCNYMAFKTPIYFPYEEDLHWDIRNMEMAIKKNGAFLSTGDLFVYGVDTAVVFQLEMIFFSPEGDQIDSYIFPEMEFYNEKSHAEPIVLAGRMNETMAELVDYFDLKIKSSKRVPYYDISVDCYLACKEHKLKEAIKQFKKTK